MIRKLLGLQGKVGIEAIKEHVESDVIGKQMEALEITIASQIEDNQEDILKIDELQNELDALKLELIIRNDRYENLLEVLG